MYAANSYTLRHDARPPLGHVVSMRGRKATTPLGKWPNTVAARRRARDMTQDALALASGLNLKTLQKIERWGQRLMPEHQAKLAPVLGCTFEELLADPTQATAPRPAGGPPAMSTASSVEQLRRMQSAFTRRMMARWPPGVPFDPELADGLSADVGDLIDQAFRLGGKK